MFVDVAFGLIVAARTIHINPNVIVPFPGEFPDKPFPSIKGSSYLYNDLTLIS